MRVFHFRAQNGPFILNKIFLPQAIIITLIYQLALFIVRNLNKFLQQIQSYENATFLGPKWSICPPAPLPPTKKIVFEKFFILFSSNYQPLSLCKILKNSSTGSRVMRMCNFWTQNCPFPRMRIFSENLLMSLVAVIHAYLHAKNKVID